MTHYFREYVRREETQSSDNTVLIVQLPKTGVISMLDIEFRATNGSTNNEENTIPQILTRIEVIGNGSEIIYSATGQEAVRLAWKQFGRLPAWNISEDNDAVQYCHFPILFGRHAGDPLYALSLDKFTSVDLRLTYNLAAVRAVSATTAFVTGTANVSVIAYRSTSGGASPRGYMRTMEAFTFTSTASGDNIIDLPIKNPYVGIGVYAYESAIADDVDITRVQVRQNRGERLVFDSEWNQLQRENAYMFNIDPTVDIWAVNQDADTLETWTGTLLSSYWNIVGAITVGTTDTVHLQIASIAGAQLTWEGWTIEGSGTWAVNAALAADNDILSLNRGIGIGNFVYVPLDLTGEWLDPFVTQGLGNFDVVLTNGGAGATVGVVIQDIVSK